MNRYSQRLLATLCLCVPALALPLPAALAEEGTSIETASEVFSMQSMNVFRRHAVPAEEMFHFYGQVLGFAQLGTYELGNGGVTRFRVGGSELKFTGHEGGRDYIPGGVADATGVRLITFYYPDQAEVEARFVADGRAKPEFATRNGRTSALVKDPDGQWVELVIEPGRAEEYYQQIEIGLTVSDIDASRQFYGAFMGLEEREPEQDGLFNTTKYAYQLGNVIVALRELGEGLPADTGSGGIQYVVSDAIEVEKLARARKVAFDQPTYVLEGFNMLFLWLEDPDGITNYFAQGNALDEQKAWIEANR